MAGRKHKGGKLPAACWKPTRTLGRLIDGGYIPGNAVDAGIRAAAYGITLTQMLFVAHHVSLGCMNATEAYIRTKPGVHRTTAGTNSHKWLRDPKVAHAVKAEMIRSVHRVEATDQEVLATICSIMRNPGHKQQLKAAEIMGDYLGMWDRSNDVNVNINAAGGRQIPIDERVMQVVNAVDHAVEVQGRATEVIESANQAARNADIEDAQVMLGLADDEEVIS